MDPPHEKSFTFSEALSTIQLVARIVSEGYLASIAGGKATWSAVSGVPLAVVAQQWKEPRAVPWDEVPLSRLEQRGGAYYIHFNYHVQRDPEDVLQILKELKLYAP
jgi:hypothetical protein